MLHEIRQLDVIPSGDTLKLGSSPMKTVAVFGLLVVFTSGLFAQRHVVNRTNTIGTAAGFGNVVFPGGRPAITTPFTQTNTTTFTPFVSNVVVGGRSGFNGSFHRNFNGSSRGDQNSGSVVYVPYAFPVYGGGGGGYSGGYYTGYGDPSMPPPQQQP